MPPLVPVVDPSDVTAWCEQYLGSPDVIELFRGGYMSSVIGIRLADGREVVVKVRPAAPRLAGCVEVHGRLFASGYPCPQPLTGAVPLGNCVATAETYVPGDYKLPRSKRSASLFAEPFARLIELAPIPGDVPSLKPSPSWTGWDHDEVGLWPRPEDHDVDLNAIDGPAWVDDAGRKARERLCVGDADPVIGHGDWYAGNLRWSGDELIVVHDWDSVITDSEAALVGFAAAVFPTLYAGDEATILETEEFLAAYASARGLPFSAAELELCWAAGVWLRAFDSKKQYAVQQPVRSLTEHDARERLHRAGVD